MAWRAAAAVASVRGHRRAPRATPTCAPERSHVTAVAGTTVAWAEQGAGEALVLLHGVGDSRRTWCRVAPALSRHYRVLMPDLPGHGLSGRPDAPYTLPWFAQVVAQWMTSIGVSCAHLIGHSFGGGVAQWLLLDHRAHIDRLALIAAGGLGREVGLSLRLASLPFPEPLCSPASMWIGTALSMLLGRRTFGNPPLLEILTSARLNATRGTGRALCRTVRGVIDLSGQSVQTRAGAVAVATLPPIALLWGSEDRILPLEHGRRALDLFRGATLEIFPGCGHYPHREAPARVAAELLAFLGDRGRPPARLQNS